MNRSAAPYLAFLWLLAPAVGAIPFLFMLFYDAYFWDLLTLTAVLALVSIAVWTSALLISARAQILKAVFAAAGGAGLAAQMVVLWMVLEWAACGIRGIGPCMFILYLGPAYGVLEGLGVALAIAAVVSSREAYRPRPVLHDRRPHG